MRLNALNKLSIEKYPATTRKENVAESQKMLEIVSAYVHTYIPMSYVCMYICI